MTNIVSRVALLALGAFGHLVEAKAAGWYGWPIKTIQLNSVGNIIVVLWAANSECGSSRIDYLNGTEASGQSILSALLSWQAQGKTVNCCIENCSGPRG